MNEHAHAKVMQMDRISFAKKEIEQFELSRKRIRSNGVSHPVYLVMPPSVL